jgi:hypothetical protein
MKVVVAQIVDGLGQYGKGSRDTEDSQGLR